MVHFTKRRNLFLLLITFFVLQMFFFTPLGQAGTREVLVLKQGMKNEDVLDLQMKLRKLGLISTEATGYFGCLTTQGVKNFQTSKGLKADGIAGPTTLKFLTNGGMDVRVSKLGTFSHRSGARIGNLIPWFSAGERIFPRGSNALVTDVDTGLTFWVRRTQGFNHADCETLTARDTAVMKGIYGGSWSWNRRAIVVSVNGRRIAASMAGMPHGGEYIENNNMPGHFDIHFYRSKTHGSNSINSWHQAMVKKAAGYR